MTRTTTCCVSKGNIYRAEIANHNHAALFLRIHADGSTNHSLAGTSMLYPAWQRGWSQAASTRAACRRPGWSTQNWSRALGWANRGLVARSDLTGFNWAGRAGDPDRGRIPDESRERTGRSPRVRSPTARRWGCATACLPISAHADCTDSGHPTGGTGTLEVVHLHITAPGSAVRGKGFHDGGSLDMTVLLAVAAMMLIAATPAIADGIPPPPPPGGGGGSGGGGLVVVARVVAARVAVGVARPRPRPRRRVPGHRAALARAATRRLRRARAARRPRSTRSRSTPRSRSTTPSSSRWSTPRPGHPPITTPSR